MAVKINLPLTCEHGQQQIAVYNVKYEWKAERKREREGGK